ncbi:RidA family protein, partial [Halobium palmae]
MNGQSTTRYEGDSLSAIGGYGVRKRDVQLAFFDGQYPAIPETTGSLVEQTTAALERVADVAGAAGVGTDDILRTTVYTTAVGRRD